MATTTWTGSLNDVWTDGTNWTASAPVNGSGVDALVQDNIFGTVPILGAANVTTGLSGFTLTLTDDGVVSFDNVSLASGFVLNVLPTPGLTVGSNAIGLVPSDPNNTLTFASGATINIGGPISGAPDGALFQISLAATSEVMNDGSIINSGFFSIGNGLPTGAFVNNGIVTGGTDAIFGAVTGSGTFEGKSVSFHAAVANTQTIDFGAAGKTELDLYEYEGGAFGSGAFSGTLTNMGGGNRVVLEGVSGVGVVDNKPGTLTLSSSAGTITLFSSGFFANPPNIESTGSGTALVIPCFAGGTRIRADRGEVAVENLREGDRVALARGGFATIVSVAHLDADYRRHSLGDDALPVRVIANSFASGTPVRDVILSPDHAIFIEGALLPVRYLVNGATIVRERVAEISYFHLELPAHDVILAHGLPVESYLDTGNRNAFQVANCEAPHLMHLPRHAKSPAMCGPEKDKQQATGLGGDRTIAPERSKLI